MLLGKYIRKGYILKVNYLELQCEIDPFSEEIADILTAALNELGFEHFLNEQDRIKAYIKGDKLDLAKVKKYPDIVQLQKKVNLEFSVQEIKSQNWNTEWETHFEPIIVADQIYVRSTFHPKNSKCKYEIIIDPKMSFGTGHSPTTDLMLETMLDMDFKDKRVLDMGCGTSVLGIFASKLGAKEVICIDFDEWAVKNSQENLKLNNINNVKVILGDASLLMGLDKFDIILANINLNVLLSDMSLYQSKLNSSGKMLLSGFYQEDLMEIAAKARELSLTQLSYKVLENWVAAIYAANYASLDEEEDE